jgi:hypothetical protein
MMRPAAGPAPPVFGGVVKPRRDREDGRRSRAIVGAMASSRLISGPSRLRMQAVGTKFLLGEGVSPVPHDDGCSAQQVPGFEEAEVAIAGTAGIEERTAANA